MKRNMLLVLVLWASTALGTTYHVADSTWNSNASDGNDGLTWTTPIATPYRLEELMSCGDTALFGTGSWDSVEISVPVGCDTNGEWTVYACSSYVEEDSSGNMMQPTLRGGWLVTGGWADTTINGNSCVMRDFPAGSTDNSYGNLGIECLYRDEYGYVAECDGGSSGITYLDVEGEFYWDGSAEKMYVYPYPSDDFNSDNIWAAHQPVLRVGGGHRILVWGLKMRYGMPSLINIASGTETHQVTIQRCDLRCTGGEYSCNTGPIAGFGNVVNWETWMFSVDACTLAWAVDGVIDNQSPCPAAGFDHGGGVTLYSAQHADISNNVFWGYLATGVTLKNADYDGNDLDGGPWGNNNVRYNIIRAYPFYESPVPQQRAGILSQMVFENDSIYGNYIIGPWGRGMDIYGGQCQGCTHCDFKLFCANNTLYGVSGSAIRFAGSKYQEGDTCGYNNEFKYNITAYCDGSIWNDDADNFRFREPEEGECISNCETGCTIDSNIYYDSIGTFNASCDCDWIATTSWIDWRTVGTCKEGWAADQNSSQESPGFSDPHDTLSLDMASRFSRPDSLEEMSLEYDGRTWTLYGAWQPEDGGGDQPDSTVTLLSPFLKE